MEAQVDPSSTVPKARVSQPLSSPPFCICRGADGTIYWATWCPRCEKDDVQTAIAGNQRNESAQCSVCGTTVAIELKPS